jgi:hypothetical protein
LGYTHEKLPNPNPNPKPILIQIPNQPPELPKLQVPRIHIRIRLLVPFHHHCFLGFGLLLPFFVDGIPIVGRSVTEMEQKMQKR